jgi:hypothetical protein
VKVSEFCDEKTKLTSKAEGGCGGGGWCWCIKSASGEEESNDESPLPQDKMLFKSAVVKPPLVGPSSSSTSS